MQAITLKQDLADHLYAVIQDNRIIDRCDLLAAEEIAIGWEEQGFEVKWSYLEDQMSRHEERNGLVGF